MPTKDLTLTTMGLHTTVDDTPVLADPSLLRLLQLVSPALPIGAFAYSQGLETAIEQGWLRKPEDVRSWLEGVLTNAVSRMDIPVFVRLWRAFDQAHLDEVRHWNAFLLAARGAAELRAEDAHLGQALLRVLKTLGVPEAMTLDLGDTAYATTFALAARHGDIPCPTAALGFAFAWAETQVGAAVRLVPLGQSDGVKILAGLSGALSSCVRAALHLSDHEIATGTPGLALASAWHETQYSRLFRS